MVRTQILLDDHQHVILKEFSREQGVSMSALVRQAVDQMLTAQRGSDRERASALLGAFDADRTDVSENHDRYLWTEDPS